jgi:hypothetical protein
MDFRQIGCEGMNWWNGTVDSIGSGQAPVVGSCEHCDEPFSSIEVGEFD